MPGARSHKLACAGIPFAGSDIVPGLPIVCLEAADQGQPNLPPPPPGRLWQGSEQGPPFWFVSFPTAAVGLCVPCSDPRGCNTKSLPGWRCRLLGRCAVRGAGQTGVSLASSATWQWKCSSCQDPKPNHQLLSAPACFRNKALITQYYPCPRGAPASPPAAAFLQKRTWKMDGVWSWGRINDLRWVTGEKKGQRLKLLLSVMATKHNRRSSWLPNTTQPLSERD